MQCSGAHPVTVVVRWAYKPVSLGPSEAGGLTQVTAFISAQALLKSPFSRDSKLFIQHLGCCRTHVDSGEIVSSWQLKKQNSIVTFDVCVQRVVVETKAKLKVSGLLLREKHSLPSSKAGSPRTDSHWKPTWANTFPHEIQMA